MIGDGQIFIQNEGKSSFKVSIYKSESKINDEDDYGATGRSC